MNRQKLGDIGVCVLRVAHERLVKWFASNPPRRFRKIELVVYHLLQRANDTTGAILCLYDSGHYSPAMGLTRLMFELALDVAIIEADPPKATLLEEYNKRMMVKWWKVWSARDSRYINLYKQALKEFEHLVPLIRREGKKAKRWMKDRWGYNLRALSLTIDPTGCLTRIYDVVVRTEQVHLHGGLLPECCLPDSQDVPLHIWDNANYLLDIVEHCRGIFSSHPLPDFADLTNVLDALTTEVLPKATSTKGIRTS